MGHVLCISLSVCRWTDVWVIFILWLLRIMRPGMFVWVHVDEGFFRSYVNTEVVD